MSHQFFPSVDNFLFFLFYIPVSSDLNDIRKDSKLYSILSQGLQERNASKERYTEFQGYSDHDQDLITTTPGNDSDGTASDDELVIDLKDDVNSQAESDEDAANTMLSIANRDLKDREPANVHENKPLKNDIKVDINTLCHMNLNDINGDPNIKKKFLQAFQNAVQNNVNENMDHSFTDDNDELDDQNRQMLDNEIANTSIENYDDISQNGNNGNKNDDQFEFKKFRNRREYTQEEQLVLLTHFQHNHFPPTRELKLLAKRLSITHRQIMHWFQNRRSKERKALPYSRRVSRQCMECKAAFVHDEGLSHHKSISHNPASVGVQFGCPVETCLLTFPSAVLLQTHELLHEKKDIQNTKKSFSSRELQCNVTKTRRILVSI